MYMCTCMCTHTHTHESQKPARQATTSPETCGNISANNCFMVLSVPQKTLLSAERYPIGNRNINLQNTPLTFTQYSTEDRISRTWNLGAAIPSSNARLPDQQVERIPQVWSRRANSNVLDGNALALGRTRRLKLPVCLRNPHSHRAEAAMPHRSHKWRPRRRRTSLRHFSK